MKVINQTLFESDSNTIIEEKQHLEGHVNVKLDLWELFRDDTAEGASHIMVYRNDGTVTHYQMDEAKTWAD